MSVRVNTVLDGGGLKMNVQFDLAQAVVDASVEEVKKVVHEELIAELERNEEFRRRVRELAIAKIVALIEPR